MLLGCFVVLPVAGQQRKEPQPPKFTVVGPPLPAQSLAHLWDLSQAVVSGTVKDSLPPQTIPSGDVFRYQLVAVDWVWKDTTSTIQPQSEIRIRYFGGTAIVNGREHKTTFNPPPPSRGSEVVAFLQMLPDGHSFVLSRGANGLFAIEPGEESIG